RCGHQWEPIPEPATGMRERTSEAVGVTQVPESLIQDEVVAHETVAFLREHASANPEKPWFLCAGFSRPHFPLTAPKRHLDRIWPEGVTEPRVPASGDAFDHPMSVGMRRGFKADGISRDEMMYARACYFACVSYLDEVIGDLLMRLERSGLLENTIIVYTTDHGEMAGEHGVWWKNGWYEACTRVPLIVSLPEHRSGNLAPSKCRTPVALVDLFPTLTGLAGVGAPGDLDGVDISEATRGGDAPDRPVYTDALNPRWGEGTEFRMVRRGRYKYVRFRSFPPLAFDLEADPGEQMNLLGAADDALPEAVRELAALAESSIDFDEAERERTGRDGGLRKEYAQDVERSTGNLYVLPRPLGQAGPPKEPDLRPTGKLVNAEDALYNPTVIADQLERAFGERWERQNGGG
ncbi:MAG: sulfatase-like hydrolase/transferase, partial [Planctomycetota bacterium]